MSDKKLTPKQELFCKFYVVDYNASKAAREAGYSAKTAFRMGQENMQKPAIQQRIKELNEPKEQRPIDLKQRVIDELAAIAFSNAADLYEDVEELNEDGTVKYTYRRVKPDLLKSDKVAAVACFEPTAHGQKIKVKDSQKALELLGKHLGVFNADITQKPEINQFDFSKISSDKLRKIQSILKGQDDTEPQGS